MLVIGIGITFVGYSFLYYGLSQVRGGNWGYLDLVVPARWAKAASTPMDGQAG